MPGYVTMVTPADERPVVALARDVHDLLAENSDLPAPRYLTVSQAGQEVSLQFGGSPDTFGALAQWGRANRVQALLDSRQDNRCQSRPPRPRGTAENVIPGWPNAPLSQITWRRNVARQSPEDTADQPTAPRRCARPSGG